MINQTLTPLTTPPSSNDVVNFDNRADEFLAELPTMVNQMNTVISQINTTESGINSVVTNASSLASQITILRNEVVAKAAEIKSYVIPTSAINTRRIRAMQILN